MDHSELVSVILPVFNVAAYLSRCLDSLLCQSYRDLEIICVDDGSTDDGRIILEAYSRRDGRVRVICQENLGVSSARNTGLAAANGVYVAFVDPDDRVDVRYIEILMQGLSDWQADVSACNVCKIRTPEMIPSIQRALPDFVPVTPKRLLRHWSLRRTVTGKIYRKGILSGYLFNMDLQRSEDTLFNLNVLCHSENIRIVYIDMSLYYYFDREDSLTHQIRMVEALGFSRWYCEHPDRTEITGYEWVLRLAAVKLALSSRYFSLFEGDGRDTEEEANTILRELMPGLLQSRHTPLGPKLFHLISFRFPFIYRLMRLVEDPTMFRAEKDRLIRKRTEERRGQPERGRKG